MKSEWGTNRTPETKQKKKTNKNTHKSETVTIFSKQTELEMGTETRAKDKE